LESSGFLGIGGFVIIGLINEGVAIGDRFNIDFNRTRGDR